LGKEAPLILKALKIVSFALVISTVALAGAAGYSAYKEYSAISKLAGSELGQMSANFSGNVLSLSGLQIPNNMTFPLSVDLNGRIWLDGSSLARFDSGRLMIPPGQVRALSVNATLDFSQALSNRTLLEQMLLSTSTLKLETTIAANAVPLVGMNITKYANTTMPAILTNFQVHLNQSGAKLSSDYSHLLVPVSLNWNNPTPITLSGGLNFTLTSIPGKTALGNYGTGGGNFTLVSGANQNNYTLSIPVSDLSGGSLQSGAYSFEITISAFGNSVSFPETVNV
jgi:hypothetical protein